MALTKEQFAALRAKGLSVEQIVRFERGEKGATLAPTPAAPVPAPSAPSAPRKPMPATLASHPLFWLAQQGVDLPTLLGSLGGFAPGPVGRSVSAVGGASGSVLQQLMESQSVDPMQVGRDAMTQLGLTMGGQVAAGASRAVGTGLMRTALRPGVNTVRHAPGVVKDALEQGATVRSLAGTGGEKAAGRVVGERGAQTAKLLQNATNATAPLGGGAVARIRMRMSALLPNADDVVGKASPHRTEELNEARALISSIAKNYKGAKSPVELKEIKTELQRRAKAAYETLAQGKRFSPDAPDLPMSSRIYWKAASNVQKALEGIPESAAGGSIKAAEGATKKAIGVRNAVRDATLRSDSGIPSWVPQGFGRGAMTAGGAAIGGMQGDTNAERAGYGTLGALAGGALADPSVTSRLAHLFYQQHLLPALMRQSPRAAYMMFGGGEMPPDTLRDES